MDARVINVQRNHLQDVCGQPNATSSKMIPATSRHAMRPVSQQHVQLKTDVYVQSTAIDVMIVYVEIVSTLTQEDLTMLYASNVYKTQA